MEELFRRELIEKHYKINHTVWASMIFCLLVYLTLSLKFRKPGQEDAPVEFIALMFLGFAASTLLIGFLASKPRPVKNLDISEAGEKKVFARFRKSKVIALALFEATALYGFILCLLGQNLILVFIIMGAALAAMVSLRPTRQALEAFIAKNLATARDQADSGRDSLNQ